VLAHAFAYDASMTSKPELRCAVCQSDALSEPAQNAWFKCNVHFDSREAAGLLGPKSLRISPKVARACLDCGHVMVFLDQAQLSELRNAERIG
jgi:hypothetical protein